MNNDQYVELIRFFVITLTIPNQYIIPSALVHASSFQCTYNNARGSKVYYWMHNGNASWQIGCFIDENRRALFWACSNLLFHSNHSSINAYNTTHHWNGYSFIPFKKNCTRYLSFLLFSQRVTHLGYKDYCRMKYMFNPRIGT